MAGTSGKKKSGVRAGSTVTPLLVLFFLEKAPIQFIGVARKPATEPSGMNRHYS